MAIHSRVLLSSLLLFPHSQPCGCTLAVCELLLVIPFQKFNDLLEFCELPLVPGRSWASPAPAFLRRSAGKRGGNEEGRGRLWSETGTWGVLNVVDALIARGVIEHVDSGLFFFPLY